MKALLFAALVATQVVSLPALPWTHYAQVPAVGPVFPVQCPQGVVQGIQFPGNWVALFTQERDVWIHYGEDEQMDAVHYTRTEGERIVIVRSAEKTGPQEACGWLFEAEVHEGQRVH